MRALSYAKINLSLNVSGKNREGMHLLDSVAASVSIADAVTVCARSDSAVNITYDGKPSVYENDSIKKAVVFLQRRFGSFGADIAVEKRLPEGAGVGGSSADAAAAITLIGELFGFFGKDFDSGAAASEVGSDVPLMCRGGFCRFGGIGESVCALDGEIEDLNIVLYCGDRGVSSAECFKRFDETYPTGSFAPCDNEGLVSALCRFDLEAAAGFCGNALTVPAAQIDGGIKVRLRALKEAGALNAFMTGSGSACVGLYKDASYAAGAAERLNALGRGKALPLVTVKEGIQIL